MSLFHIQFFELACQRIAAPAEPFGGILFVAMGKL